MQVTSCQVYSTLDCPTFSTRNSTFILSLKEHNHIAWYLFSLFFVFSGDGFFFGHFIWPTVAKVNSQQGVNQFALGDIHILKQIRCFERILAIHRLKTSFQFTSAAVADMAALVTGMCLKYFFVENVFGLLLPVGHADFKGCGPEWRISSMLYS